MVNWFSDMAGWRSVVKAGMFAKLPQRPSQTGHRHHEGLTDPMVGLLMGQTAENPRTASASPAHKWMLSVRAPARVGAGRRYSPRAAAGMEALYDARATPIRSTTACGAILRSRTLPS
jgi:hypothetical protein